MTESRIAANSTLRAASDETVDFIVIGCPHASLEQVAAVAALLDGKRLHDGTELWIFTPRAMRATADRMGYTKSIERAGAHLMSDSCAALSKVYPEGVKVAATDSCKQAHYLPAILGFQTWLGTTEQCVDAALTVSTRLARRGFMTDIVTAQGLCSNWLTNLVGQRTRYSAPATRPL